MSRLHPDQSLNLFLESGTKHQYFKAPQVIHMCTQVVITELEVMYIT